mgnify:CR=1 FL=1
MTTLTWPSFSRAAPRDLQWALIAKTQVFQSPLNGAIQTGSMPGAQWSCAFTYNDLDETDSALLEAVLLALEGRAGRIALWNWQRESPRGVGGGTPLVRGGSQVGGSLDVDGAPLSTTAWLRAGDYVGVNGELKMLTANVDTNGSGQATLAFKPNLRSAPADNAPLTLTRPTATFMLADDTVSWSVVGQLRATHTLRFIEAFA